MVASEIPLIVEEGGRRYPARLDLFHRLRPQGRSELRRGTTRT